MGGENTSERPGSLGIDETVLRKVLDLAPMAMAIVNLDGTIEYINQKAVETFGFPHSDIPTMDRWWAQAYPDKDYREKVVADWMGRVQKAFVEKTEIPGNEYLVTCKDGSRKNCFIFGVIAANKVFVMFEDITDRVRTERTLREKEGTLRRILDNAPVSIAILSMAGAVEHLNRKFVQTIGYTTGDLRTYEDWVRLAGIDDRHREESIRQWIAAFGKAHNGGGEIDSGDFRVRCKNGAVRTFHTRAVTVENQLLIMFEDITDRLKAESSLRESETALRRILEQCPICISVHDLAGNVEFVNSKFTQTFGYRREDMPDLEAWSRKAAPDEEYRKRVLAVWRERIDKSHRTGLEMEGGEFRVACKDGSIKTAYVTGVVTADGKVVSLLEDITARTETQKALRESESRYRALVETTRTGYVIINKEGRVIDANTEYVRLTGRKDLKEVIGHSVIEWTAAHEKDRNAAAVAQCARDGYICNFEVDYADGAGRTTPIEINANVVTRDGVPQILTLCRDISARRKTEADILNMNQTLERRVAERTAELTQANEELKAQIEQRRTAEAAKDRLQEQLLQAQKMEAVGRLAGGIAHDFNNILVSISGYAEILMETLPSGSPARSDLSEILLETERGGALTRQLLTFSSRQEMKLESVDLNSVAAASEKMLKRLIGSNMHLETALAAAYPVTADPTQVSQVIVNLVINARDAMPDGGRIRLATSDAKLGQEAAGMRLAPAPGEYVELSVTDSGTGMDDGALAHLFEPFYTTKKAGQGTGLGLSTVYGIVSRCKGGIAVESSPGKGTSFRVYLPRAA